ncbi:unnamed protein product [Ilex paraguariensis]|uniref:Uncharacterized protein n=1 Tax=Ilex paraguariensis TaxID=185542 RepID=A0ABC8RQG3_9AQUA
MQVEGTRKERNPEVLNEKVVIPMIGEILKDPVLKGNLDEGNIQGELVGNSHEALEKVMDNETVEVIQFKNPIEKSVDVQNVLFEVRRMSSFSLDDDCGLVKHRELQIKAFI